MYELLSATQMSRADAMAIAGGISGWVLMERAGHAVADAAGHRIESRHGRKGRVVAVAGPGNNGGDAAVAASVLQRQGIGVLLIRYRPDTLRQPDARQAFDRYTGAVLDLYDAAGPVPMAASEALADAGLIIDGLFGAGLMRGIEGLPAELVHAMNGSSAPVLAVDLPSGLNGDDHTVTGPVVQADHTVTFFRLKPAHLLYPGRALCGQVELAQIGIPDSVLESIDPRAHLNQPNAWHWPSPHGVEHKYHRGAVLVRSGGLAHSGASRLAAGAALQCGAGLVTLACPGAAMASCAAQLTAVMLARIDTTEQWVEVLSERRVRACVIGPGNGVGAATLDAVLASLQQAVLCVLDADALTSFADDPTSLFEATRLAERRPILTPHDGEFQRLFGASIEVPQEASRLHRASAAAEAAGAIVVLKGADTVIAHPDGRARINANGPAWLATAGSGDVLAGLCAALTAQGMGSFDAASAAVWLHGQAALKLGYPLRAEELAPACAEVMREVCAARGPAWPLGLPDPLP